MSKPRKLPIILIFWIMTAVLSVCSVGSCAPALDTDPGEIVAKAYQKLFELENYHMVIDITAALSLQGTNMNFIIKNECDVQKKPLLSKNTMNFTVDIVSEKTGQTRKIEEKTVQYMEETEDQMILYSCFKDRWVKQTLPKYNQFNQYDDSFLKAITSVIPIYENVDSTVYEVTVDEISLRKSFDRAMAAAGTSKLKLPADLLKGLGDCKLAVTIDRDTAAVSRIDIDMSGIVATIGNNVVGSTNMPDDQKKMARELLNGTKLFFTTTFSRLDDVEKITIPQEAKDAAVSASEQRTLPIDL